MSLPYAADAETSLSPAELGVLRNQYEKENAEGHASTQTKFNYAWGLVKSPRREDMVEGVSILTDIYRTDPPRRRECLYYLALGHYKLGNFEEARRFNAILTAREPNNLQAKSLGELIERGVAKGGSIMTIHSPAEADTQVVPRGLHWYGTHCRCGNHWRPCPRQPPAAPALITLTVHVFEPPFISDIEEISVHLPFTLCS